jgi:hypothetical protein
MITILNTKFQRFQSFQRLQPLQSFNHSFTLKMTNCSFCKVAGHNKRTCSLLPLVCETAPDAVKVKRKYTCSHCNVVGHNSRSCGLKSAPMLETGTMPGFTWDWWSKSPEPVEIKKIKKTRRCACCGDTGHNTRTCSLHRMSVSPSLPVIGSLIGSRKARTPDTPNRGVQVTQVVDFDIYDEPWVWAPIRPVNRALTLSSSPVVLP